MNRGRLLPFALIAALLSLLVIGCGSNGGAPGATAAGDAPSAAADGGTPKDGGTLRLASTYDLEPGTFFTGNYAQSLVSGLVYDKLVSVPATGLEPKPSLATSWKLSPDGKTMTLQLRSGVKFQNGRPLTSKDVQFSIEQYADPKRAAQFQRTAAAIVGFDTSKPDAITLKLEHPVSNLYDLLSVVPILEEKSIAGFDQGKEYIGTGPFEFVSWTPNSKIVLKANQNYWGGAPHLDGVEMDVVPSAQSAVAQLRSGEIDGVYEPGYTELENLKGTGQFDLTELEGVGRSMYIGVNVQNPALEDVRLREAIAYAVDRERIVSDVFRGYGTAINLPWPEYSPAFSAAGNKTYTHDPAKAEALVAQIGKVATLPLSYPAEIPTHAAAAQIVQSDLEEVGIPTKLEPIDAAQEAKDLIGGEFPGIWIAEHGYANYSPSTLAVSAYPFNAEHNASNFSSQEYEKVADAAWEAPTVDSPAAKKADEELNRIFLKELFLIELVGSVPVLATTAELHDFTWSKRAELNLSKAYLGGEG